MENDPGGVRSAAFQRETLPPPALVTRTRSPSKAAANGRLNPLPVRILTTAPVEARTTVTEESFSAGTPDVRPVEDGLLRRGPDRDGLQDRSGRVEPEKRGQAVSDHPDVRSVVQHASG